MAHAAHYEWMTAKINGVLTLTSQRSTFNFTGQLRMRHDSAVWVSASFMGMEAMRALVTNDTVVVVNRLEKTYLAEPFSSLVYMAQTSSFQPATLNDFQTMLLGNGVSDTVEIQWRSSSAKIQYSDIQWDEPTTFPIKINDNYERMKL